MPRKPPEKYNVHSAVSGAQIVTGVTLALARSECARLNAEARQPNPDRRTSLHPQGEPTGMHLGELTTYEVRSASGLVVA
jgi:hypothetical protein